MINLEYNFIAPRLQGRTGNMMFQIANVFAKSLEYNRQLIIPSKESSSNIYESNLFRSFEFVDIDYSKIGNYKTINSPFHYTELDLPSDDKPTRYCGWYQSEKFFKNYSSNILDVYSPTEEFIEEVNDEFKFLKNKSVCAINVRRGDYLTQPTRHPVITKEYINEALKQIPKCEKYLVLSDDIEWCRENIKIEDTIFVENYWDWRGLWLMSQCNNFVLSNSSYSWWGAYLSRDKNKKVITPSTWVGPDITDVMDDIWCDGWIKIPTKYSEGKIILDI